MTWSSRIVAALVSLASGAVASAQDAPATTPRLGLGISVDSSFLSVVPLGNMVSAPPILLYVPVLVTPSIRIEPSIGWISTEEGRVEIGPMGTNTPALRASSFSIGLGALHVRTVVPGVQATVGGRVSAIWSKEESAASGPGTPVVVEASQQNLVLSAVLGGEYAPTPWFSIGLEGQLSYAHLGGWETTAWGTTEKHEASSSLSTNAIVTLRTYFF